MDKKQLWLDKYYAQIEFLINLCRENNRGEAIKVCEDTIKLVSGLDISVLSDEEQRKMNDSIKLLKSVYEELNAKKDDGSKSDDMDLYGVRYVIDDVDVRDFLFEWDGDVTLSDVYGMDKEKDILSEIWTREENQGFYDLINYKPVSFYLFYGVPGTGKTFLANAVLSEVKKRTEGKCPTYILTPQIWHYRNQETEKNIHVLGEFIKQHDEFVLFVENIEDIAQNRRFLTFERESAVSKFIAMLERIISLPNTVVIGAASMPGKIDAQALALARVKIEFALPNCEAIYSHLEAKIGKHISCEIDMQRLASRLEENGYSSRDITNFIENMREQFAEELFAVQRNGETRRFDELKYTSAMVEKAFSNIPPTTRQADLIRIAQFRNNL